MFKYSWGRRSGFCCSKMNSLTISEDESIHLFTYPSTCMYEEPAECKWSARWWLCKQIPATVLGPQALMASGGESSSIRCNTMRCLLSRSVTVGLERHQLCLGEQGECAEPAAVRGERASQAEGASWAKVTITQGPGGGNNDETVSGPTAR